jgi:UDP-N-acetylglucosamine 2-epimerase (non-hydrolysing)
MKTTLLCVVGTRPEAIKMAPVILALRQQPWARVRVLATAQHREMLDEAMAPFGISADIDLNIMRPGQTLPDLTARLLTALDHAIDSEKPAAILAQGDTTTVLAAALSAFYRHVPFCHVEAGLRTGNPDNPFPEEMNRALAGRLARLHFAPTEQAKRNLLQEGIPADRVFVTGNTVIDALYFVAEREISLEIELPVGKRLILLTAHRRENFGAPLLAIFQAVRTLAQKHQELHFVYPVHLNPNVAGPAREILGNLPGVTLCPPLSYGQIVSVMKRAWLVLTDSGGLQEEAPALHKPVLVLRDETERPEAVHAGVAKLVGPHYDAIVAAVESLMTNQEVYQAMSRGASPYGDGFAAQRIVMHLENFLRPGKAGNESEAEMSQSTND